MKLRFAAALALACLVSSNVLAGPPLRVDFKNKSKFNVTEIYLVIAGSRDGWGKNMIAGTPVPPGGRTWLMLADGADKCVDDIRVVSDGGKALERRVRFCGNPNFVYHGR